MVSLLVNLYLFCTVEAEETGTKYQTTGFNLQYAYFMGELVITITLCLMHDVLDAKNKKCPN